MRLKISLLIFLSSLLLYGCSTFENTLEDTADSIVDSAVEKTVDVAKEKVKETLETSSSSRSVSANNKELAKLTFDSTNQVVTINNNQATFSEEELSVENGSWQRFSDLDKYNRVGIANAMLSESLMPHEERESLYVDPTGWKNKKITVNGKTEWLYNRCHLIGFQLTGENNNLKNLMTCTNSLNNPHMLKYENLVANYIKETNHKVRYQVEPIFKEGELVARGVHMQAKSIKDDKLDFNVFIFNVESGIDINYNDGSSKLVQGG